MAEPTLLEVFGSGAIQDANTITISKTDLVTVGLTADANNTAESLLAAIVLLAREALTSARFETTLEQSITIEPGFDSVVQRDDGTGTLVSYKQNQLNINLHKLDASTIDPDDY